MELLISLGFILYDGEYEIWMKLIAVFMILLVGGTTIWAVLDASELQSYMYKGHNGAFVVFIGCALLWIVVFPVPSGRISPLLSRFSL